MVSDNAVADIVVVGISTLAVLDDTDDVVVLADISDIVVPDDNDVPVLAVAE